MAVVQTHRVLLYTTCYNVLDGVSLTVRKIEQELLAAGHHVCILTSQSGSRKNTNLVGTHPNRQVLFLDNVAPLFFTYDPNNTDQTYYAGVTLSQTTQSFLAEFNPSVVHVTVPDLVCMDLILYARQHELPLIGTYHSNYADYIDHYPHYPGITCLKPFIATLFGHQYNFLQRLYVPTPYMKKKLVDSYQWDRLTELRVWGRGTDLDKFSPSHRSMAFRQKHSIDDDKVVICFVGRLVREKRIDIFAEVVRRLHSQDLPFHALVVGVGPCEDTLRKLPNTTLCGWLTGPELSVAYASSDIFLLPSSVETFGNVTLEAAASGLPLVVESECSGHLVSHGVNGYACQAGDVDAFFEGTRRLIKDSEKRESFSRAGRELSLKFEQRSVMKKMIDNYAEVTEEFRNDFESQHENRDKKVSFPGGNHPRPLLLLIVVYMFVWFLLVMWYLTLLFFWIQERLPRRTVAPTVGKPSSTADRKGLDEGPESPTTLNSAGLVRNDAARSTPHRRARLVDSEMAHWLVRLIMNVALSQARVESSIRNTLTSCIAGMPRIVSKSPKRKMACD